MEVTDECPPQVASSSPVQNNSQALVTQDNVQLLQSQAETGSSEHCHDVIMNDGTPSLSESAGEFRESDGQSLTTDTAANTDLLERPNSNGQSEVTESADNSAPSDTHHTLSDHESPSSSSENQRVKKGGASQPPLHEMSEGKSASHMLVLPTSQCVRIAKAVVPQGTIISKDVKEALTLAAGVFILYTANSAHQESSKAKRKTMSGVDVMRALKSHHILPPHYLSRLDRHLQGYNDSKKRSGKKPAEGAVVEEGGSIDVDVIEDVIRSVTAPD